MGKKRLLFKRLREVVCEMDSASYSIIELLSALNEAVKDFNRQNGTKFNEIKAMHEFLIQLALEDKNNG